MRTQPITKMTKMTLTSVSEVQAHIYSDPAELSMKNPGCNLEVECTCLEPANRFLDPEQRVETTFSVPEKAWTGTLEAGVTNTYLEPEKLMN